MEPARRGGSTLKQQAEAQVIQIARNLLQTGMNEAQVAQVTGLAIAQIQSLRP
ncbi:MAG: hypothetical protein ACFB8W_16640 [Elainellaceae cyanobacterium]